MSKVLTHPIKAAARGFVEIQLQRHASVVNGAHGASCACSIEMLAMGFASDSRSSDGGRGRGGARIAASPQ